MTTVAQITAHDAVVDSAVEEITAIIVAYWASVLTNLTNTPVAPTPVSVRNIMGSVSINTTPIAAAVNTVLTSSGNLLDLPNNTALISDISNTTASIIVSDTKAMAEGAASEIISTILAGAALGALIISIRDIIEINRQRAIRAIAPVVIHSDAAYGFRIMRDAGIEKFTYRGGIAAGTREFCAVHNNKTYTEAEIRRIWSSQSWGGKAPGDPFVVRGGYNCRHRWVPQAKGGADNG